MKILVFILFAFFQIAHACEILLPYQMVVFHNDNSGKSIYQAKNCEANVIDDLHQMVSGLDGRVASYQLKEMMTAKGHNVDIGPQSVLIQQFSSLVRDQMILPTGVQVKSTRVLNRPGILALPAGDRIEVKCQNCLFGLQQPLNVSIRGFDGSNQSIVATADFKKMIKAYRITGPITSFSSIEDISLLHEEFIEAIPHTDLVTDLESLKFYKTNKPLKTGEYLKKSDLNAINLVKAGLKTDVVLENQMIRIKTQGISRSNGAIGELVEVYHPQKNKKYQGKVIDINKVLVEL